MANLSELDILKWNVEVGADEIISESPSGFYTVPSSVPVMVQATLDVQEHKENSSNNSLEGITTLEELKQAIQSFTGCALKKTAMNTVFSDGCPTAKVMLIGEAPGADEDRMGKAFVGRSGQLLDKMLASVGLSRESNVYISNIIPWRPPGNRTPSGAEVAACLPFIKKHIELVNPSMLLLLGKSSSAALLNTTDNITRLRGRIFDYRAGDKTIPALVTFHPAFLLRDSMQKRLAWQDMLKLQKTLKNLGIYDKNQ